MNLLLPQIRPCVVRSIRPLDIHGDRYWDIAVTLEDPEVTAVAGRVSATECPPDLAAGERVSVSFTMGVMTRVSRLP